MTFSASIRSWSSASARPQPSLLRQKCLERLDRPPIRSHDFAGLPQQRLGCRCVAAAAMDLAGVVESDAAVGIDAQSIFQPLERIGSAGRILEEGAPDALGLIGDI